MTTFAKRIDTHFAACAAAAAGAAMLGAEQANAAVISSGIVNIAIPNTFAGVYVNMVTGVTSGGGFAGQDFNPYNGGANMWMGGDGFNRAVGTGAAATNFQAGGSISLASTFVASAFPTMANWAPGQMGYMGLKFRHEGLGVDLVGWIRLTRGNGGAGTIHEWAYEDSGQGITIPAIPAPGALAMLALGALAPRRSRKN